MVLSTMPIVSLFFGIIIRLYHDDHNPPHFHVEYGEFSAVVEISNGRILFGKLPRQARRLVEEWRRNRKSELRKAWSDAISGKSPTRIKPLE
jgi:hypothetical protein